MVQFFERGPTRGALQSQILGQGIGQAAGAYGGRQMNKYELQQGLEQVRNLANNPNASPIDTVLSLQQAIGHLPGAQKAMPQLADMLVRLSQARQAQDIPQPTDIEAMKDREIERKYIQSANQQRQEQPFQLPEFGQKPGQQMQGTGLTYPTNISPNQAPGNVPQEAATQDQVRPVYTPHELTKMSKNYSLEQTRGGRPMTPAEARNELKEINEENKNYNAQLEKERSQRVASQTESGNIAEDLFTNVMPDATDEQKAIFRKRGEEVRRNSKSEADFKRNIAVEAKNFKNAISNVESDISAPRLQNMVHRAFQGTNKDMEKASQDMKVKLKPLLDLGLYDTARNLLEKKGYYPEEREYIINPLSDKAISFINQTPKARKKFEIGGKEVLTPGDFTNLQEGLQDTLKKNPDASLVLIRKQFEDKGYDWRSFKDALNELMKMNPEEGGFKPSDDQFTQIKYLDSPPLNNLEKLLHGLNIIGR